MAYLVWDATRTKGGVNVFDNLVHQPKNWGLLAAAWAVLTAGLMVVFVRWWVLLRAVGTPCQLREAVRAGFWGYLFNLAPLGVVGGDVVKAVMLARAHRQRQPEVVASVIVDRVIGLYVLFAVATAGILLTGFATTPDKNLRIVCQAVFLVTSLGTLGIAAVWLPDRVVRPVIAAIARLPRVGSSLKGLLEAIRLYRHKQRALLACCCLTVGVHSCSAVGCWLIAHGLPGETLAPSHHFVIIPLSIAGGVLPLPMGPFEFIIEFLYTHVAAGVTILKGQGLVVALTYRLMGIFNAAAGSLFCFGNRQDVRQVIHEAEEQPAPAG